MPKQASPAKQRRSKDSLYQLKITLRWSKPPIWRRVLVPANTSLDRLHAVIQDVMGWTDSHLHQFVHDGAYYGAPAPDPFFGGDDEVRSEKRHKLSDLAPDVKSRFTYEYDFGDSWEHEVKVEKILPPDENFKHPVCLAGENACPPEDCGGIPGYYGMLEVLADPKHPEHDEIKEWLGGDFDPAKFDLNAVNSLLKRWKV